MSTPNEVGAWDADFSYGYLELLYGRVRSEFELRLAGDLSVGALPRCRFALIRHDVDVSLDHAVMLAERELAWDVPATYHVMIDSPFYDVLSKRSIAAIHAIAEMGHEVGLHYDSVARKTDAVDAETRRKDIEDACRILEGIVERPVRSLSFHRPTPAVIGGPLHLAGRVSAYASDLCQWYLSDSRGRWREGNPLESLGRPRGEVLQILIHPIWWGARHATPAVRLREFLLGRYPAVDPRRYDEVRNTLWDHISFRAADL